MEIVRIRDGGVVKDRGRMIGEIIFEVTTSEGKPETLVANCAPNYRDSIIKNLRRLAWRRADKPSS